LALSFRPIAALLLKRLSHQTEIKTFDGPGVVDDDSAADRLLPDQESDLGRRRILDVFMEIYAISVIATLAGAFGSFLHKRGEEIRRQALTDCARPIPSGSPTDPRGLGSTWRDQRDGGGGIRWSPAGSWSPPGFRLDSFRQACPTAWFSCGR
jgi:hypothetical protein